MLGYLTRLAGLHLLKRHQRLMIMGYEYAEGDVAWDGDKVMGSGLGEGFGLGLGIAEATWHGTGTNERYPNPDPDPITLSPSQATSPSAYS